MFRFFLVLVTFTLGSVLALAPSGCKNDEPIPLPTPSQGGYGLGGDGGQTFGNPPGIGGSSATELGGGTGEAGTGEARTPGGSSGVAGNPGL